MNLDSDELFSFGPFRLLPTKRRLEQSGEPVRLSDRAFDMLVVLARHAPDIVGKATLLAEAWPDVTVEEGNLRLQMNALRRALGTAADGGHYIHTAHGRGYCFVAPLTRSKEVLPPPPETGSIPNNLPRPLGDLIGRGAELTELDGVFQTHRLVTLVGAGGIGKTRLAIELGHRLCHRFPGGVRMVDLAALTDPGLVTGAVAAVLGVKLQDDSRAVDGLAAALGSTATLLIFDNCEHLVDSIAPLTLQLLEQVPGLSVLATSQSSLRIPSEQLYRLRPLALPPQDAVEIAGFGAVALFVERARIVDRRFQLDAATGPGVAEICRALDGLPLALEMAAGRLPLLGLDGLRCGLDERLKMLKTGRHAVDGRHGTLRALVAWSHGLLDETERAAFRRLGRFLDGFSLEAATAVADAGDRWEMLDTLEQLVDKSLVTVDGGNPPRYRLLETLRVYALEQLDAAGERETTADRHARYFTALVDQADTLSDMMPNAEWTERFGPETANLRAALDWALADPDRMAPAIALAGGVCHLWFSLGLSIEGRAYADRTLGLIGDRDDPLVVARLLRRAGSLWFDSDRARALDLLERSAALYRRSGAMLDLAFVLANIGSLYTSAGRQAEAKATLGEALDILARSDRKKALFNVMNSLGLLAMSMEEPLDARAHFTRALDLAQETGDSHRENITLGNLAEVEFALGNIAGAVERGRQTVARLRAAGRRAMLGIALLNLASYLITEDDAAGAKIVATEALSVVRAEGGHIVRVCLQHCAMIAALEGRVAEAAPVIGFVDAGYAASGTVREPTEQRTRERLSTLFSAGLETQDLAARMAEGARWTEARAVDFAVRYILSTE